MSKVLTSSPGLGRGLVTGLLAHGIGLALVLGDSLVHLLDDIRTDGGGEDGREGVGGLSGLAIGTQDRDGRSGCHFCPRIGLLQWDNVSISGLGFFFFLLPTDAEILDLELASRGWSGTDLGVSMAGWLSRRFGLRKRGRRLRGRKAAKFEKFWVWWVCEFAASWAHSAVCSPCAVQVALVQI